MIGDPTGALTRNFDIMREDQGLADRGTFIVDPEGIIRAVEITAEGIGRDASDLLRKVKAAQYVASHPGEVCPAKWKEGEATLAPSLDRLAKSKLTESCSIFSSGAAAPDFTRDPHARHHDENQLKAYLEKLTKPVELIATRTTALNPLKSENCWAKSPNSLTRCRSAKTTRCRCVNRHF